MLSMTDWVLPLLRCLKCGANHHVIQQDAVICDTCGKTNPSVDGVITFFADQIHPVLQKELQAIQKLDASAAKEDLDQLGSLLRKLDLNAHAASKAETSKFGCMQHLIDSRNQILEVLTSYPVPPGSVVLEIGADHCWISNLFLDRDCRVIALDISEHLHMATRAADKNLCRIKADMNCLPLADKSCDFVWATSAVHHSWDLRQTFREAKRVLKPNGKIFFCCEPLPSALRYPFGHDFGQHERSLGINECWIPRNKWVRYCREAGFHDVQLIFPNLNAEAVRSKLQSRKVPLWLAPIVRPILKALQVSIHLTATNN